MINLQEHKVYVEAHKMEMVPLSIAEEAIKEAIASIQNENEVLGKLDEAIATLSKELANVETDIESIK